MPRFPAFRIDSFFVFCFFTQGLIAVCVVGGRRACACTGVETTAYICTLCSEKQAVCCMGMWKILQHFINMNYILLSFFLFCFSAFLSVFLSVLGSCHFLEREMK